MQTIEKMEAINYLLAPWKASTHEKHDANPSRKWKQYFWAPPNTILGATKYYFGRHQILLKTKTYLNNLITNLPMGAA